MNPPSVSAPAFVAVQMSGRLQRRTGPSRRAATPATHALGVLAGGRASVFVPGQKAGSYALEVDGAQGS
jgi:hypothetical protein